ncbi:hypothetical protein J8L98_14980 [Pseudoalteromonas sp. MMG013]|uniref:Zinc ribbon domain-containing protein n=1 Tax=Pseudoalteromonas aurantia 208 TaxID=1314867 RepID=A0ABR9EBE2_9GAMM|nr:MULTISPECIES: hypothetical protein [Pseudoalteromonas]MBE0367565.1 hypothetical protein [Pseudoalteromonas aurantia 208]MBQ4845928.1 hypothetical protein [Pseudoalteromonas sp. MMG005]MBQ4849762.1 hypothetical protein [Pseudoalteromonas sp. MMG012]MBQ4862990.1 hypothetical protein [Pseudoalteromonas sp. MMG013]
MAIVQCPSCNKSISSKSMVCSHCQTQLGDVTEEQLARIASTKRIQKQQMFINHSFLALILFLGGFLYLYWQQPATGTVQMALTKAAIGIGCFWYLVNRVILVYLKKKK